MSNLEVFWKADQQFPCQIPSDNVGKIALNPLTLSSDYNILSSFKLNNGQQLPCQNYQQFLNLSEDECQQSVYNQLCYDDCEFFNQEQMNLIQNVNGNFEGIQLEQENCMGSQVAMSQEQAYKLLQKQKRQYLREKAKNRKRNAELIITTVKEEDESTEKSLTANIKIEEEQSVLVQKGQSKEKKKQIQQIRNRISAQMSRDKKKAYVQTLEENSKKLEEKLKALEEENNQLQQNINLTAPIISPKQNITLSKREAYKYGFAFFSFMALFCSIQMQNNTQSLKQVDTIEQQPIVNNTEFGSINSLTNFNSDNDYQDMQVNEQQKEFKLDKVLPRVNIEEEVIKEEINENKIELGTKKIKKQKKPRQKKIKVIDSK